VFNRLAFSEAMQGEHAGRYLYETLGVRRLAIAFGDPSYGEALASALAAEFRDLGGEVVAYDAVYPGEIDYDSYLASIADLSPDALFYAGFPADAAAVVERMEAAGLGDVLFMSGDLIHDPSFVDQAGSASEGVYAASHVPYPSPEREAFDRAYQNAWGDAPGVLTPFTWHGYDAVAVLIDAVERVAFLGDDGSLLIPRGALIDAVRSTEDYQGLTGTITCDASGECSAGPAFYRVDGGEWVPAPEG
jgi:branched-chain amino acid transport system substrate-binding protein